jgi:large subunit ribosomal protein L33
MNIGKIFVGNATLRVSQVAARPMVHRDVACMAKKKGTRCIITLECTEARPLGKTPSRYITQKNKKNTPGRLEIKKYNKFLGRMTLHREIK